MKMREADETAKIRQAYANAVPDICDAILTDCKQGKGKVVVMTETKKKKSAMKYIAAAAGLFLLLGCGGVGMKLYQFHYAVASTISLDVNPSIQVTVNEKERVLDVVALNKDAGIVIGDMDFKGSDIDVVINALVGSMLRKGYLNELANSILISVDNADPAKGAVLQEKLTAEVNNLLASDGFFGAVLGQTLAKDDALQKQADQYGITPGKAQLIQEILNTSTRHTFDELAALSINELNLLIAPAVQEIAQVSSLGNASDKAYIGEAEAKKIAFAHANVAEQDINFYKMDMDVERGVMVYELDFTCGGYEYEYDIDARTGDIVKNQKEVGDNMIVQKPKPVQQQSQQPMQQPQTSKTTETQNTTQNATLNTPPAERNTSAATAGITLEQAKDIALNHAGQSAASVVYKKEKLDYYNGVQFYKIEFISGYAEYDYEINSVTGEILDYSVENKEKAVHNTNTGAATASITLEQAKEIALNHAGQSAASVTFTKAKLDHDDGMQIYDIEFISGGVEYEVEINAATGQVWDYDVDYD